METNPTGRFLFVENDDHPGMVGVIEVDNEPSSDLLATLRGTPGILRVLSFER